MLKKILYKIVYPHGAITALVSPFAFAMVIYALANPAVDEMFKYVSYFFSAYALIILCARVPWLIENIGKIKSYESVSLYMSNVQLKAKTTLHISVAMNTVYAIFQLGLGIVHKSVWFYSLSGYYLLLAIMRFFLLRGVKTLGSGDNLLKEIKRYRFCGIVLCAMNLALGVIVFYITWQNRGFVHHSITTIAMAAYTFTAFTLAIINMVRYRKYNSPLLSAAKAVSLVSACVSMLTLETAMINAFDETNNIAFRMGMTMATGTAVCAFVLIMAIYMIVKANKQIADMKGNKNG